MSHREHESNSLNIDWEEAEKVLAKAAQTYRHEYWTEQEVRMVEKWYLKVPTKVLAKVLKRSPVAVRLKATNMGYTKMEPYQIAERHRQHRKSKGKRLR